MNSINEKFNKKVCNDITNIKKIEHIDYIGEDTIFDIKSRGQLGKSLIASIDYEVLCTMGDIDIAIYQDGTFGIGKECVTFGINDLGSLQNVIKFFYGTPFNINIKKMNQLNYVRYMISIPEIKVDNFRSLEIYIEQITISLNAINEHCYYDS